MNNRLFYRGIGFLLSGAVLAAAQSGAQSGAQAGLSLAIGPSTPRNFTCTTDRYLAQIRWQGRQPQLTFGERSTPPDLSNVPVEELSRRSIVTYITQQEEAKTTVFVYSDGTCAVAVTDASGDTTVNELGQIAYEEETVSPSPVMPDETIVSFQTRANAVRIFTRSGETLMNVYDQQQERLWMNGIPVKQEQTSEGTRYTNTRGELRVEVLLNLNGDRILVIDGAAEAAEP